MSDKTTTCPQETPSLTVEEVLLEAEKVVSFYEGCLDAALAENQALESEIARLKSLFTRLPKRTAPPGPSWGNRWRPN